MSTDFSTQGLDQIMNRLQTMGKQGVKIENNAIIESAKPILEDAQNTVAFKDKTGKLRESLKISKVKTSKGTKTVWVGDVDRNANYSWYVEYGSSGHPPRPFLKPAFDKNKDKILENIKKEIIKGLNA